MKQSVKINLLKFFEYFTSCLVFTLSPLKCIIYSYAAVIKNTNLEHIDSMPDVVEENRASNSPFKHSVVFDKQKRIKYLSLPIKTITSNEMSRFYDYLRNHNNVKGKLIVAEQTEINADVIESLKKHNNDGKDVVMRITDNEIKEYYKRSIVERFTDLYYKRYSAVYSNNFSNMLTDLKKKLDSIVNQNFRCITTNGSNYCNVYDTFADIVFRCDKKLCNAKVNRKQREKDELTFKMMDQEKEIEDMNEQYKRSAVNLQARIIALANESVIDKTTIQAMFQAYNTTQQAMQRDIETLKQYYTIAYNECAIKAKVIEDLQLQLKRQREGEDDESNKRAKQ